MYESALPRVLKAYGIKPVRIYDFQSGYRNEIWPVLTTDNQMINITFYKREEGIADRINLADKVAEYLRERGMPARKRLFSRLLVMNAGSASTHIAVYDYLPGETIPWEAYTMEHIKSLGCMMGRMHVLLKGMAYTGSNSVYDEYLDKIQRMRRYFVRSGVKNAMKNKLGLRIDVKDLKQYEDLLNTMRLRTHQHPLHMDFVRGNILFEGAKITGVLDFEKTAVGHSVVDISRTLAFLLVDCKFKLPEKVIKYFLASGYQKRGKNLDIGKNNERNQLIKMFLIYDFYKFLIHNPYESLKLNEHYRRTKDILVKYNVILCM